MTTPKSSGTVDPKAVVREVFPPPPPLVGWLGFYYDSGGSVPEEDAGWYCSGRVWPTREEAICELAGYRPFEGSALVEVGASLFAAESPATVAEPEKVIGGYQPIATNVVPVPPQGGAGTVMPAPDRCPKPEGELPEVVRVELAAFREEIADLVRVTDALESWARAQASGAKREMSEDLAQVLLMAEAFHERFAGANLLCFGGYDAIRKVRAEYGGRR